MSTSIERLEALFNQAIEFRPDERAAFLAGACGKDSALLAKVQALLRAHEAGDAILPERPRGAGSGGGAAEKPGDRIGRYKLLEQIGEGGCGVVYMADQEVPLRRRVALKVMKLGMDTKQVVARFEAERQALALMDHPNIAKVLDAGATQTGRPYFVMELVRGVKITDYCEQHRFSARQRLALVTQVCRAIQHAHQKGIIHRDIKPSNVLVTAHDDEPVPKVIDFGIAKAIEGRLTEHTLFTSFEQFLGTPAYMSPEQAQLKGLDVDTRTDIYSLGVLLYELLTGTTPFDAKALLSAGLDEMRRTIREQEPLPPSTRLTLELARAKSDRPEDCVPEPEKKSGAVPSRWVLDRKELISVLRGDLDWIVMKCLEKDRTRRYETANGLAMDLERHLKGEPVAARPPSRLYRFQKLVRRNRLAFLAAAATASALVLGTIGSIGEAIRARRAERTQSHLREEAEQAQAGEARQRTAAEQHLYDALLGEARAKQITGRTGQRFESLEAITKAAALRRSTELSDAAISALALPDLREQRHWRFPSQWVAANVCFDESCECYASLTPTGVTIRRARDDHEVSFLPVKDVQSISNRLILRGFDPRGRYLAASCEADQGDVRCRVWDLTRGILALDAASAGIPDFTPDGRAIAVPNLDGTVSLQELETGKELKRFRGGAEAYMVRLSADGTRLAGFELGGAAVWVWDVASGQVATTLLSPGRLNSLAWNSAGSQLATGHQDGQIIVWDVESGRAVAHLAGHEGAVTTLAFSHQGDLLASGSWDSTLRLWDAARGRQLVLYRTKDVVLHFSPDDQILAHTLEGDTVKLLELVQSTGSRRLFGRADAARAWSVEFSSDDRMMAVSANDGIGLWDAVTGREIGLLRTADCRSARFESYGGPGVIGCTSDGLYRWPLRTESAGRGSFLRVEPPQTLLGQDRFRYAARDGGSRILVSRELGSDPLLLDLAKPGHMLRLMDHPGAQFVSLDPAGRWAATGTWKGTGVKVYDAATGALLRELPIKGTACVAFSPDEQWLAAADMNELRLWKTGSWESGPRSLVGDLVSEINPLAFSPDGRLLAAVHAIYEIQILKVPGCELVATLRVPTLAHLSSLCFNHDGTKFAALEWGGQIDVWDLRVMRGELAKLNLDWDLPPFPAAADPPAVWPIGPQLDAGPFSKEALAQAIPSRGPATPDNLIDLTDYYNAPLTASWHSATAAANDLSELPAGVRTLAGVEFDIRGLIQLGTAAANGLAYPNHVLGIPINGRCHRLHFLHASILSDHAHPGDELGSYLLHYADGRQVELPIVEGKDMADWWSRPSETGASCVPAWTGSNPEARANGYTIRLFQTIWDNPSPEVPIRQFDFESDKPTPGQPFLVAVTADP
jgi:eukaryotic-like serine/threonine-protein kinase